MAICNFYFKSSIHVNLKKKVPSSCYKIYPTVPLGSDSYIENSFRNFRLYPHSEPLLIFVYLIESFLDSVCTLTV